MKQEKRLLEASLTEKETEIQMMHSKYEELLGKKDQLLVEARAQFTQQENKLKFEIEFLRKESIELMKQVELGIQANPQYLGVERVATEVPFRVSGQSAFKQGKQPSVYV